MNPIFKALFLALMNYLVYAYIIMPVSYTAKFVPKSVPAMHIGEKLWYLFSGFYSNLRGARRGGKGEGGRGRGSVGQR